MKIFIGADHRGFELKEKLKPWLKEKGHEVTDCGNNVYDPEDDYVDFANEVARKVLEIRNSKLEIKDALGILACGSGVGVSVVANRYKNIICALGFDEKQVAHARENDHANCLSLPSDYMDFERAKEIIEVFLNAVPKTDEKYLRRIKKVDEE